MNTPETPPTEGTAPAVPDNRFIRGLQLENFRGIPQLDIPEFYGINLFLGENNTGKSGLLKLLYGVVDSIRVFNKGAETGFYGLLFGKLRRVFNLYPPADNELLLISYDKTRLKVEVDLVAENGGLSQIDFCFQKTDSEKKPSYPTIPGGHLRGGIAKPGKIAPDSNSFLSFKQDPRFLASKEILAFQKLVRKSRRDGITDFDDTYYDLSLVLADLRSIDRTHESMKGLHFPFSDSNSPRVIYDDQINDFALQIGKEKYPISAAAEGIRKVGTLEQLIRNRELVPGMVLFVDEPETGLHPTAIRDYMQLLIELSKRGIQIFMASHSYFVLRYLELFGKQQGVDVGCYSLLNDPKLGIRVAQGNLREGIPENAILEEASRLFDLSIKTDLGHA